MNIVIVVSGGVGSRFGAAIPKQYVPVAGRPVIDYVLDALEGSKKTDKTVVVMDPQWRSVSQKLSAGPYDFAPNGDTRLKSMYSGLALIKEKYSCEKVMIVDAVRPFITGELIDRYFDELDSCDVVITAEKITGGFTDIYDNELDREKYIITQSPEGFRFDLLWDHFNVDYPLQETAGMLPKGTKRSYIFGVKSNLKLTYDYELEYFEYLLKRQQEE